MKSLSKVHLINWLYIPYETLNLTGSINFFTGGSGSGKSAIIDALQLLLLGNPKGSYFNKAGNDKSERTLIDYLCGKVAEDDEKKYYLRDKQHFFTYVVVEIFDEDKNKRFCLGGAFEVKSNKDYMHFFFYLNGSLPSHNFLRKDGSPMSFVDLEDVCKDAKSKGDYEVYTTDHNYRRNLINRHLGRLGDSFFDLFKKTVSFSPTEKIEDFILRFMCEEETIDINQMQENIRSYKKFEQELKRTKDKIGYLDEIENLYDNWKYITLKHDINSCVIAQAEVENAKERIEILRVEINNLGQQILKRTAEQSEVEGNYGILEGTKNSLNLNIISAEEFRREQELTNEINNLKDKIQRVETSQRRYALQVTNYFRWNNFIQDWEELIRAEVPNSTEIAKGLSQLTDHSLSKEGFERLYENLTAAREEFAEQYSEYTQEHKVLESEKENLIVQNTKLEKGDKSYPGHIDRLRVKIHDELSLRHKMNVPVYILADLLEIPNPDWTNAIEGFFGQKFSLIIEPEYCLEAVEIYRQLEKSIYGVEIINTRKIAEQNYIAQANSLAEELRTDNIYAKLYVNYKLGNVIKCDKTEELDKHNRSITMDCMVYSGFAYSKISPNYYEKHYIGKDAILSMISRNVERIEVLVKEIAQKGGLREHLRGHHSLNIYTQAEIDDLLSLQEESYTISTLVGNLRELVDELDGIDLIYVMTLKSELVAIEKQLKECQENKDTIKLEIGIMKNRVLTTKTERLPEEHLRFNSLEEKLENNFNTKIKQEAMPLFEMEYSSHKDTDAIKNKFDNINKHLKKDEEETWERLVSRRQGFSNKFLLPWNHLSTDNAEFTEALKMCNATELPEYEEKIKVQKQKAYGQFKDDFICRMKNNIRNTEMQIGELNKAIRNITFGKDKYRFIVTPSKKYSNFYKMLTDDMLSNPGDIFTLRFAEEYKDEIDALFSRISDTGEIILDKESLAQNIKIFTDYRTYLNFDMVVVTGDNTPESYLSKTMGSNSGGETQSPYYIAILASFVQLYQMNNKLKNNSNIRLIIFDEAFSKMGDEHIANCIRLIKEMGFQLIIAAPDKVISLIAPEADKTFCFRNENKQRITIVPFEKEEVIQMIN